MKYTVDEIIEYVEASIGHNDFADDEAWFSRTMREEILKALKKCQWIPVSERLPERGRQVMCCNENGNVFTSSFKYEHRYLGVVFGKHYGVIAWMPLPEPYEGDDNKCD